jgi:demethylmenaquinone methyltransferase/2-methoxy-6-polyprenyl-1,4-benzoquinol methylase
MSSTGAQVRELFDRIAPHYDTLNQSLSFGLHQVWKGMTVLWANPPQGGKGLDICCGSGDLAFQLARQLGRRGEVYGIDFSGSLLAIARQRSQLLMPNYSFRWYRGNALQLPFADSMFDTATMGYGLRNVGDIPQALSEIYRILKPGSWAAILDFNHPTHPCLRSLQSFYLETIVVPRAKSLGLEKEYAYILSSLQTFPPGSEQQRLAKMAGFSITRFYPLSGGLMGVLVLQKT